MREWESDKGEGVKKCGKIVRHHLWMIPKLMERLEGRMRQKVGEEATIEVIDLQAGER